MTKNCGCTDLIRWICINLPLMNSVCQLPRCDRSTSEAVSFINFRYTISQQFQVLCYCAWQQWFCIDFKFVKKRALCQINNRYWRSGGGLRIDAKGWISASLLKTRAIKCTLPHWVCFSLQHASWWLEAEQWWWWNSKGRWLWIGYHFYITFLCCEWLILIIIIIIITITLVFFLSKLQKKSYSFINN